MVVYISLCFLLVFSFARATTTVTLPFNANRSVSANRDPLISPVDAESTYRFNSGDGAYRAIAMLDRNTFGWPGAPDGLSVYALNDTYMRILCNHETGSSVVSSIVAHRDTLEVVSVDTFTTQDIVGEPEASWSRLCSADMALVPSDGATTFVDETTPMQSALYYEGNGTLNHMHTTGEESGGGEAWAMDADTGAAYRIVSLGKQKYENAVVMPRYQQKTVIVAAPDEWPCVLCLYVGEKNNGDGDAFARSGLASPLTEPLPTIHCVQILSESGEAMAAAPASGDATTKYDFVMLEVTFDPAQSASSQATAQGATTFSRGEDAAFEPHSFDLYFVLTAEGDLWRFEWTDVDNVLGGGKASIRSDSEMAAIDNVGFDHRAMALLTQDGHVNTVFSYNTLTGAVGSLFRTAGGGEFSGVVSADHVLGAGWWLVVSQGGGQLLAIRIACGDGVCDSMEDAANECPQDCGWLPETASPAVSQTSDGTSRPQTSALPTMSSTSLSPSTMTTLSRAHTSAALVSTTTSSPPPPPSSSSVSALSNDVLTSTGTDTVGSSSTSGAPTTTSTSQEAITTTRSRTVEQDGPLPPTTVFNDLQTDQTTTLLTGSDLSMERVVPIVIGAIFMGLTLIVFAAFVLRK